MTTLKFSELDFYFILDVDLAEVENILIKQH